MKRDLSALANERVQILVVGGGVYGAAFARDAAARGLSVALVEKDDFLGAASGNSFRMVHGGIRYVQHGDVARVRASSRERTVLLGTAPHLVRPLPIAIPTYGRGMQGRAVLRTGIAIYDLLTADKNRRVRDPDRRTPWGRSMGRDELLGLFPGIERRGLTGAGLFSDAQMLHPQRLGLAMLRSAVDDGARVANHVEVTRLVQRGERVEGVEVRDALTGEGFRVEADVVVLAAGAWSERLVAAHTGDDRARRSTFSRDLCLVIDRPADPDIGVAVLGRTSDPDAILSRSKRHLFVVPWRDKTIVGVWHIPYERSPDDIRVGEEELRSFVDELNAGYPGFGLTRDELTHYNTGLVLFGENRVGAEDLRYGHRSLLIDHATEHGIEDLYSLIGVRYTTARVDSQRLLDRIIAKRGWTADSGRTAHTPVRGGDFETFAGLVADTRREWPGRSGADIERVCRLYGTDASDVLGTDAEVGVPASDDANADLLAKQVRYSIREEMAVRLQDIVVGRTDLGLFGAPPRRELERCVTIMARELGWDPARCAAELRRVEEMYPLSEPVSASSRTDSLREGALR
ncbi:MAG: FAD-dependent oxidoreductase [Gemmatimonadetes bacterium]|nr:FAD-dependent oxidoreductase [Gemmatimonadota bacterium]